jgi:hypothetical protein
VCLKSILAWPFVRAPKPDPKSLSYADGYFFNSISSPTRVTTELRMDVASYTDAQLVKAAAFFVQHDHMDKLQHLLRQRPQLSTTTVVGGRESSLLHLAILDERVDAVNLLLATDASTLEHLNSSGQSPLHLASSTFSLQCARLLLEWGADVEREDAQGATPLCVVCLSVADRCVEKWQFKSMVKILQAFEADEFKTVTVDGVELSVPRLLARAKRHQLIPVLLDVYPGLSNIINVVAGDDGSLVRDCERSEAALRYLIDNGAEQDLLQQLHTQTDCIRVRKRTRDALSSNET